MSNMQKLPDGTYPAIVGGYVSKVHLQDTTFSINFPIGVKGFGIKDTVTVSVDKISSRVLGPDGKY